MDDHSNYTFSVWNQKPQGEIYSKLDHGKYSYVIADAVWPI